MNVKWIGSADESTMHYCCLVPSYTLEVRKNFIAPTMWLDRSIRIPADDSEVRNFILPFVTWTWYFDRGPTEITGKRWNTTYSISRLWRAAADSGVGKITRRIAAPLERFFRVLCDPRSNNGAIAHSVLLFASTEVPTLCGGEWKCQPYGAADLASFHTLDYGAAEDLYAAGGNDAGFGNLRVATVRAVSDMERWTVIDCCRPESGDPGSSVLFQKTQSRKKIAENALSLFSTYPSCTYNARGEISSQFTLSIKQSFPSYTVLLRTRGKSRNFLRKTSHCCSGQQVLWLQNMYICMRMMQ